MHNLYNLLYTKYIITLNHALHFLSLQSHAKLDPDFISKYNNTKDPWIIMHEDGGVLPVRFNQSLYNLTLCDGWTRLKEKNAFPDNVEVVFVHFGDNSFGVIMFTELNDCTEIPSFHSRSLNPLQTKFFDIELSSFDYKNEILVKLTTII